jgi:prolyl-tRNA editing enzyme YbaK/EbsC (Cys-tRNA(Pro) deacylase)
MAPAEEVRRITGFAIGGVPPMGHTTPLITLMDTGLLRWPTIYAAAGAHDALFPVNPHRLAEITKARMEDLGI